MQSFRKIVFTILIMLVSMVFVGLFTPKFPPSLRLWNPLHSGMLVGTLISLKFLYKANFRDLGFSYKKNRLAMILLGTVIAISFKMLWFISDKFVFGLNVQIKPIILNWQLLALFSFMTFVSAGEEVFFRVFLIGNFKKKINPIILVLFSSIIFSLLHRLGNDNYNVETFLTLLSFGVIISLLYLISNSFMLIFSYHLANNSIRLYDPIGSPSLLPIISIFISVLLVMYIKKNSINKTIDEIETGVKHSSSSNP